VANGARDLGCEYEDILVASGVSLLDELSYSSS
jgi:hypothetical protein